MRVRQDDTSFGIGPLGAREKPRRAQVRRIHGSRLAGAVDLVRWMMLLTTAFVEAPTSASTMPGSGTDKTKRWIETPGPIIILVEPQLADNIGASARAMANFALSR